MARFPTLLATIGLVMALASAPSAGNDLSIGYVDMQRLFAEAPQIEQARAAIDREFRPRNDALVRDEERLQALEAQLAGSGAELEPRQRLEREALNLRRSIERRRDDLAEELRFRTSAETRALETTIEIAIRRVAEHAGYDLILTSPVAYASASIDVTDEILAWLHEDMGTTPR
jgi:outer membrane protein